jgi:hypothetical protein
VRDVVPCPNGEVWCIASGNVFRIRNDSARVFIDRESRSYFGALSLLVDSNRVWYGTYGGGLFLIRGDSVTSLRGVTDELGPRCLALHEDRNGYLWINAERELQRVKKKDLLIALDRPGTRVHVDVYDHRDGLINIEFNNSSANSSQLLPDGRPGAVTVAVWKHQGHEMEIIVSDDGIGLPPDTDISQTETLGLRLLVAFAGQLRGTYSIKTNPGTTIAVRFPAE